MTLSAGQSGYLLCTMVVLNIFYSLNTLGYRLGTRVLELMVWRAESASKTPKREIRFLPALMSIHTNVWKAVFGKPADAIEKSVENEDECTNEYFLVFGCLLYATFRHDH